MPAIPPRFEFATPVWMTHALRKGGSLAEGSVMRVELLPFPATPAGNQKVTRARLTYSSAAQGELPNSVVLKVANSAKEHVFFANIQPAMRHPQVVRAYYSEADGATGFGRILLEDLCATHWQTEAPIPPPLENCLECVDALARLHAAWWQSPRLDGLRPALTAPYAWSARINTALEQLPRFLAFIGDRLSAPRRALLRALLRALQRDQLDSPSRAWFPGRTEHPTLLHGDAHFWNFLFPHDKRPGGLRLFDWNSWDIGRAGDDLAYMLALHWYPERRRQYETCVLQHYHERLKAYGVTGFSFDELLADYRLACVMNLLIPVWQWQRGIPAFIWWSHLERACLSFTDHACDGLL